MQVCADCSDGFRVLLDKDSLLGSPAQCLNAHATGSREQIQNIAVNYTVAENVKDRLFYPITDWSGTASGHCLQLDALGAPRNHSHS
jgi:hypothetical protein